MVYLVVVVIAAVAGIMRLWLIQRRQRDHLGTVDVFWSSLEKMAGEQPPVRLPRRGLSPRIGATAHRSVKGPAPLDPDRREAARRRIAARRKDRARAERLGVQRSRPARRASG